MARGLSKIDCSTPNTEVTGRDGSADWSPDESDTTSRPSFTTSPPLLSPAGGDPFAPPAGALGSAAIPAAPEAHSAIAMLIIGTDAANRRARRSWARPRPGDLETAKRRREFTIDSWCFGEPSGLSGGPGCVERK